MRGFVAGMAVGVVVALLLPLWFVVVAAVVAVGAWGYRELS
jgi:hypothetical protein